MHAHTFSDDPEKTAVGAHGDHDHRLLPDKSVGVEGVVFIVEFKIPFEFKLRRAA